jgi:hypothetical protein
LVAVVGGEEKAGLAREADGKGLASRAGIGAGRTAPRLVLIVAWERHATLGILVHGAVVLGGVAAETNSVVVTVNAVNRAPGAGHRDCVEFITRLTDRLADAPEAQVVASPAGSADISVEAHGAAVGALGRNAGVIFVASCEREAAIGLVEESSVVSVVTGEALALPVAAQTVIGARSTPRCLDISVVTFWAAANADIVVEVLAILAGTAQGERLASLTAGGTGGTDLSLVLEVSLHRLTPSAGPQNSEVG